MRATKTAKIVIQLAGLCAVAALAMPVVASPDSLTETAVKRFFLAQVDARCHLLPPAASTAVTAGYLQARNTSIRSTGGMGALAPWLDQARDAADRIACDAPQVQQQMTAAGDAYRAYVTQMHLELPTGRSAWLGNRAFAQKDDWRLAQYQSSPEGDLALGLYGPLDHSAFVVMANFKGNQAPYSARLLVRDTSIVSNGIINRASYGLSDTAPLGFSGDAALTFLARDHSETQAQLKRPVSANAIGFSVTGDYVGAQGPVDAVRFDFPTRAFKAIAQLDPREDIVIAFDFPDGTKYARFEVGDMLTGLAYVSLPSPYGQKIG